MRRRKAWRPTPRRSIPAPALLFVLFCSCHNGSPRQAPSKFMLCEQNGISEIPPSLGPCSSRRTLASVSDRVRRAPQLQKLEIALLVKHLAAPQFVLQGLCTEML